MKIYYTVKLHATVFCRCILALFAANNTGIAGIDTDAAIAIAVTGHVVSAQDGEPLPGVTIQVQGTSQGTVTGLDGEYEIEVDADAVLVFSYIGYATQEISVNNRTVIDVVEEESAEALDEVVVTECGIKRQEK